MMSTKAIELRMETYREYGDVISVRSDITPRPTNQGTSKRYNRLGELTNRRLDSATANLCLFRASPQISAGDTEFEIKLLEKHAHSTQLFVPMNAKNFLVVVCLGGDQPDLSTLRAFIAGEGQGITYHPGVWHYPLIAMHQPTDFACVVYEDDSAGDCDLVSLSEPIKIQLV